MKLVFIADLNPSGKGGKPGGWMGRSGSAGRSLGLFCKAVGGRRDPVGGPAAGGGLTGGGSPRVRPQGKARPAGQASKSWRSAAGGEVRWVRTPANSSKSVRLRSEGRKP